MMQSNERTEQANGPRLSALVNVPDTYEMVRRTMEHLKAQTAATQIEVVFIVPSKEKLMFDESEVSGFHSWQVIESREASSIARGFAAGIRHAQAPIVALTEDHAYPDPCWAESFIAGHQGPYPVVGPCMMNENPETLISRADYYQAYGEWTPPLASGVIRHLPGHNSSYKREVLLTFDDDLDDLMEAESLMHRRLQAQGHELMLESKTCTSHLNFVTWSAWLPKRYYSGRQYAAIWSKPWSWPRRLLYTAASPLIPFIRLKRVAPSVRRGESFGATFVLLFMLLVGLTVEGWGHMMGYAFGMGDCIEKVARYEFNRVDDIS